MLCDLLAEVEAALAAGVGSKTVLVALHRHYGFTMRRLEKALRRARWRLQVPIHYSLQTQDRSATPSPSLTALLTSG
ncbi:hypothetical protein [Methylovulum psychrotolerans]|uniref:Uncharacterized protein n=1 Tax=Methylovulum psychrotolerans TaxID=1704499 RepID=A0A2S5CG10_9GAMM|nr:hypothetical protein [Methylovulum psychrotolerans]POZ49736.1 hypothetical protein AADEFJLK_04496 [Methylovulum psychrotolerans]